MMASYRQQVVLINIIFNDSYFSKYYQVRTRPVFPQKVTFMISNCRTGVSILQWYNTYVVTCVAIQYIITRLLAKQ